MDPELVAHNASTRGTDKREDNVGSAVYIACHPTHPPPFTLGRKWPPTRRRYLLPAVPPPSPTCFISSSVRPPMRHERELLEI